VGNGQKAAFVMNRSSGCKADLTLTLGVGHLGYEKVYGVHLDFLSRKEKERKATVCKIHAMK
jgi:hypothetical protein